MSLIDLILVMSLLGAVAGLILASQGWKDNEKINPFQFILVAALVGLVVGGIASNVLPYREYSDVESVVGIATFYGAEVLVFSVIRLVRRAGRSGSSVSGAKSNALRAVADTGPGYHSPQPSATQSRPLSGSVRPTGRRTIFISYRRNDSQDVAGRIYDRLVGTFGPGSVFKDVDTIRPGEDFRAAINAFLNQCDVVLVLIGNTWVDARDARGARRLEDAGDFVRIEIETALRQHAVVIPVLVQNAKMPPKRKLPRSMHQLLYNNAVVVRPDPDFHRDMERLVNALC